MADQLESIQRAAEHVGPRWTSQREQRLLFGIQQGTSRRKHRQLAILAALTAVVLLAGFQATRGPRATALGRGTLQQIAEPELGTMHLADGSTFVRLTRDTKTQVLRQSASELVVGLTAGAAAFDVVPAARSFRVIAGPVKVTVVGTAFSVAHAAQEIVVSVRRGRVRVDHPGGSVDLTAGQERGFARIPAPAAKSEQTASSIPDSPSAEPSSPPSNTGEATAPQPAPTAPPSNWRMPAEQGDSLAAYALLSKHDAWSRLHGLSDLLLAADVARGAGDLMRARRLLEHVVQRYPGDSRSVLASFSLGKLLLEQLGDPASAARAFAKAQALSPNGALAEDALAREAQALFAAGAQNAARERAGSYLRLYPEGRRRTLIERLLQAEKSRGAEGGP